MNNKNKNMKKKKKKEINDLNKKELAKKFMY
jgi:hypothetical protein